jgi:hypothetical protein
MVRATIQKTMPKSKGGLLQNKTPRNTKKRIALALEANKIWG